MVIAALDDLIYYPDMSTSRSTVDLTIDAANEKAAFVFRAPRTGNIDRVRFRTNTVTVGETVDVRLETVDATTGDPTGTLIGTTTNAAQLILLTDDNLEFEVTLTAPAAVTRGQLVALVIALPGATTGNMNIASAVLNGHLYGQNDYTNYTDLYTGSWTKGNTGFIGAVRYDDATYAYVPGLSPFTSGAATAFNTGSTPDERGNRFILPFSARCIGLWMVCTKAVTTAVLKLYDASSTLLESISVDLDQMRVSGPLFAYFDTSVTLAAGSLYRMTILPDTATSITDREVTVASAALMNAMPGGDTMYLTTRTDAGAWTDTATQRVAMGLVLDGLDDGTGSGGSGVGAGRSVPRGVA